MCLFLFIPYIRGLVSLRLAEVHVQSLQLISSARSPKRSPVSKSQSLQVIFYTHTSWLGIVVRESFSSLLYVSFGKLAKIIACHFSAKM